MPTTREESAAEILALRKAITTTPPSASQDDRALSPASSLSRFVTSSLEENGVRVTESGLSFSQALPFDTYCTIISLLTAVENVTSNFFRACIADTFNQIRAKYGEKESQCEEVFGKGQYNNVRKYAWVFGQSSLFPTPSDRVKCFGAPFRVLEILRGADPSFQMEWKRIIARGDGSVSILRVELSLKAHKEAQTHLVLEDGQEDGKPEGAQWTGGAFGAVGEAVAREVQDVQAEAAQPPVQTLRPKCVAAPDHFSDSGEGDSHDAIEEADDGADGNRTDLELLAIAPEYMAKLRAVFTALQMNPTSKAYDRLEDLAGSLFAFQYDSFVMKGLLHPDAWLDFKGR